MTRATWPPPEGWRADEVIAHDALEYLKALAMTQPSGINARAMYAEMEAHGWSSGHGQRDLRVLVRAGIVERVGEGEAMEYRVPEQWL